MVTVKKVAFGLEEKVACALTYVLGWVTGLVFLLMEKENQKVRFHAMQSLMFFAAMTIISFVPVIGWLLSPLVMIISFIVWLMSIYKAYNGEEFELPVAGKLAKKQLAKMK
ncbi:MAG: hypothetical protein UV54_C0028G0003 [Candidatus Beckwithbacteria bacterium GW2011_GWA2_43_10]|uniref:DUF4870 domain-containing protein n=1 Tax=Candidatus Beckwithbacteria bacterium GW2011_GWA2_43_10 TaxID=1618369 RepID=A0A0G1C284_9BACT|nr:MAG: hypothetical protein UV54_C0028G0003 [Candidatus Beckwithbacteria bacterium GW2011_GWA2_43_10]